MSFIQENRINITIGLSKAYHFLQFSDVHVVTHRSNDSKASIEQAIHQEKVWMTQRVDFAKKFNETFDANQLLPSTACLKHLIDYTNDQHPDLVLITGDMIDYYSDSNYIYLKDSLNKLKVPYLFSCGNHESPAHLFKDICQGNCDMNTMDFGEFLAVSIDNSTRKINTFQFESIKKLLTLKKPILLACHVPIMAKHNELDFIHFDDYYTMRYNDADEVTKAWIEMIASSEEVKAVFCGHIHGAKTSYIAPNKPQYCCSSGLIGKVNKIIIK